jgi:hypothetical protein
MNLCTLAQVRAWPGIPSDVADATLTGLIVSVSADFLREIRRPYAFESEIYTDRLFGNCSTEMFLQNWPITAISSVKIGVDTIDESTDGITCGWFLDEDRIPEDARSLVLVGRVFPHACASMIPNVVVEYTAGYDGAPDDVAQACVEWIASRLGGAAIMEAMSGGGSISLGDYSASAPVGELLRQTGGIPESVQNVIDAYRKPAI